MRRPTLRKRSRRAPHSAWVSGALRWDPRGRACARLFGSHRVRALGYPGPSLARNSTATEATLTSQPVPRTRGHRAAARLPRSAHIDSVRPLALDKRFAHTRRFRSSALDMLQTLRALVTTLGPNDVQTMYPLIVHPRAQVADRRRSGHGVRANAVGGRLSPGLRRTGRVYSWVTDWEVWRRERTRSLDRAPSAVSRPSSVAARARPAVVSAAVAGACVARRSHVASVCGPTAVSYGAGHDGGGEAGELGDGHDDDC
jgi:hypothetical protein